MGWWKKFIDGLIRLLRGIAFNCKSDCCACQSECMGNKEEVQCDHGTTWSAGQPKQEIMDYVNKIE